jgi:hypothetical protein
MEEFKVVSKSLMVNVEVNVKIGDVEASLEVMIMGSVDAFDVEYTDIIELKYHGTKVSDVKKFISFHNEMGIELHKVFQEKIKTIITDEVAKKILE